MSDLICLTGPVRSGKGVVRSRKGAVRSGKSALAGGTRRPGIGPPAQATAA